MNPDKLRLMLIDIFGEEYETHGGQFRVNCISPDCTDKKGNLEINLQKGIFHCWLCEYSGNIRKLFRDVLGRDVDLDEEYVSAEALRKFQLDFQPDLRQQKTFSGLPEEFCPLWDDRKLSMVGDKARQYALTRMTWDDIVQYKVGYCGLGKYKWRIIIPFFEGGEVVYFLGRAMYKNKMIPPYLNSDSPKRDLIFNYERALVVGSGAIVEGVFDAIKVGNGPPVVGLAILGTVILDEQIYKLNQIPDLSIMLDEDAALKTHKIAKILLERLSKRPKIVILPHGDPDNYPRQVLHQMLANAKPQSFLDELQLRMK